jgi:2-polyprenyl-3-methyl-5-hydroxy-6-metoxy-1,4-benzoquinol methylase
MDFSRRGAPVAQFGKLPLYQCCSCNHRFIDVSARSSSSFLEQYDNNYTGFRSDARFKAAVQQEIATNLIPRVRPPAKILDIGCGNGDFLCTAQEAGYEGFGIDISQAAVTLCKQRGLQAEVMEFANLDIWEGHCDRFDLITMWDVIEHVPDPHTLVRQAVQRLKPGGYLLIKTPRVSALTFQFVKAFPWLAGTLLSAPDHIQFFNRHAFSSLLHSHGLEQIDWLKDRPMRSRPPIRSWKKAIARLIQLLVMKVGRNGNFYVMAKKPDALLEP